MVTDHEGPWNWPAPLRLSDARPSVALRSEVKADINYRSGGPLNWLSYRDGGCDESRGARAMVVRGKGILAADKSNGASRESILIESAFTG